MRPMVGNANHSGRVGKVTEELLKICQLFNVSTLSARLIGMLYPACRCSDFSSKISGLHFRPKRAASVRIVRSEIQTLTRFHFRFFSNFKIKSLNNRTTF